MSDLAQQIMALEQVLSSPMLDAATRAALETTLRQLRAEQPSAQQTTNQTGGVNLGSATVERIERVTDGDEVRGDKALGDKVLGDKIVQQFFDGQPGEDGERLLRDYLIALLNTNRTLRLSRMTEKRQSGSGQQLLPPLQLVDVFTNLKTDGPKVLVGTHSSNAVRLRQLVQRLNRDSSPELVPPELVREVQVETQAAGERTVRNEPAHLRFDSLSDDTLIRCMVVRPELTLEAIAQTPRLVLLGKPGSGKSTALRYLALLLAQHLLDSDNNSLPIGWNDAPIPIICPLGLVASALTRAKPAHSDAEVFWQVLSAQLDGEGKVRHGLGRHLRPALRNGAALLLFDGLDELPATPGPDGRSLRTRVSYAVQTAARELPHTTRITLACRVLPYEQIPATPRDEWRLPADDGWTVRHLQPFAFGQVRQFVTNWYHCACHTPAAMYTSDEGAARGASLIEQLEASERLRALTTSPLMLTMLAILHYNKETDELPRDRARLYDECVQLLLERWEPVRTPEVRTPGILERLGIAHLATTEDLRTVMHSVAFAAHDRPPDSSDARGVLRGSELEGEMSRFLRRLRCDHLEERLHEFEQALRDETGLLHEIANDTYMFPHLTFQEYLAACALADNPKLVETAYRRWASRDGDRWREVILLLMGRLRQQRKVELLGAQWVRTLVAERIPGGVSKTPEQRQRDALLALDCYTEWEGRVALSSFEREEIEQFEQRIGRALVAVVAPAPLVPLWERLRVGRHLAVFGDPRPGVALMGPDWCNVPAGPFLLGSRPEDQGIYDDQQPRRTVDLLPFRISRYPVTNAQWRLFLEAGGYQERRWWSEAGWQIREAEAWKQPHEWDNLRFNDPNQPVVGISWYEATAFCCWLSAELGYAVRLPSEAEWEKTARGIHGRIYPWGDEWDDTKANTREGDIGATTAVGCFPDGVSPYGALDMSGNVFEWTATPWTNDYQHSDGTIRETADGESFVWRGGAWNHYWGFACCAYRGHRSPSTRLFNLGVRVVAALKLAG